MGHSYTLPVIKLLFATARTCAYPTCPTPLVVADDDHGVREIAVQIAHIRSPKPGGPRYDPEFAADKLNNDANLLLLCGVHHQPVDRNGSKYTTEKLLQWKERQIAEGGGFTVRDENVADLAARLESSLDELVQATRLQLQVRLVGGRLGLPVPSQVVRIDLDAFEEFGRPGGHLFRPGRLIGVEVENRGPVGAEVCAAGIDIDLGPGQPGTGSMHSRPTTSRHGSSHAGLTGTQPGVGSRTSTASGSSRTGSMTFTASFRRGSWHGQRWGTATGIPAAGSPARTCRSGNRASVKSNSAPASAHQAKHGPITIAPCARARRGPHGYTLVPGAYSAAAKS